MKTYAAELLTSLLLFFTPIKGLIIVVGLVIGLDTITGIYKSIKKKIPIRSRILSNVASKMLLYESIIILLYPIDFYLLNELLSHLVSIPFFATKLACVILIIIEGTSIKENINEALNIDIWKLLKNALRRAKEIKEDLDITKDETE